MHSLAWHPRVDGRAYEAGGGGSAWSEDVGEVTVALDGVGGELGRAALELLAPGGRLILYGLASGELTPLSDRLEALPLAFAPGTVRASSYEGDTAMLGAGARLVDVHLAPID